MITYTLCFLYIFGKSQSYAFKSSSTPKNDKNDMIPRVYNGWPAERGDVPYQIAFKMRRGRSNLFRTFCGGAIIAPSKLLSAAHCFVDKNGFFEQFCCGTGILNTKVLSHIYAVAGQLTNVAYHPGNDTIEDGQWRHLESVRYPPEYSFPDLDFAVVVLMTPFNFNNYVNWIPYTTHFTNYVGYCLVSGFGRTSPDNKSTKLLLAHLTLIPWRACNRMHRKKMHRFICTSSQFTDVGKGDSGGPLVCSNTGDPKETQKGILVGIVSGHSKDVGSFFTRVSSYRRFIETDKSSNENRLSVLLIILFNLLHLKFLLF